MYRFVLSTLILISSFAFAQSAAPPTGYDDVILQRDLTQDDLVALIDSTQPSAAGEPPADLFVMYPDLPMDVANALFRAAQRGVIVKLVVGEAGARQGYMQQLQEAGVEVKTYPTKGWAIIKNERVFASEGTLAPGERVTTFTLDLDLFPRDLVSAMGLLWQNATPL